MAGLLQPWWLLALVAVPLIRWLHQRQSVRSVAPVSAIFLWQDAAGDTAPGRERRPPDPAWRRRALVTALLVLALAAPYVEREHTRVTIWFDDSLSMRAIEGGESRTSTAERLLSEALDESKFSEVVRHPLSEGMPEILHESSSHWLVTDGASEAVTEWSAQRQFARIIQTGSETENVAVTRLAVRRAIDDPSVHDILVAVANTGGEDAERRLELVQGNAVLETAALSLPAGKTVYLHRRLQLASNDLSASLETADALPDDDWLVLAETALKPTVTSVSVDCGSALRSAITAHPALVVGSRDVGLSVSCQRGALPEPADHAEIRVLVNDATPLESAPVWLPEAGAAASLDLARGGFNASRWMAPIDSIRQVVTLQSGATPLIVATPHVDGTATVDTVIDLSDEIFTGQPEFAALVAILVDMAVGRSVLEGHATASRDKAESVIRPTVIDTADRTNEVPRSLELRLLAPWFIAAAAVVMLFDIALLRTPLPIALRSGVLVLLVASVLIPSGTEKQEKENVPNFLEAMPGVIVSTALQTARPGQRVAVAVETSLDVPIGTEIFLLINDRPVAAASSSAVGAASSRDRAIFEITVPPTGPLRLGVELRDADGNILAKVATGALLNVAATPVVTIISSARSTYADSLRRGGWPVIELAPRHFAEGIKAPAIPSLLVLDNVAVHDLPTSAWQAIENAVRNEAMGLLVLGGPNSFGLGGYRDSLLESLLPVVSEPPDSEPPASIMLLIDVSGSMDNSSRLQIARQAATETAKALRPADRLGLMTFDVDVRQRLRLAARAQHAGAVEDAWPRAASGGTRLLQALEDAVTQLENDPSEQDILVLLTDGFVSDEDLAKLEATLGATSVEIIGLIIVGGNSATNRGKNAAPTSGQDAPPTESLGAASSRALIETLQDTGHRAVPIDDLLRLPELMRNELEESRPALVTGPVDVVAQSPASWLRDTKWPEIQGYLLTRPKDDATVHVASEHGDAIIASTGAGAGKVVAVTSGFSSWTADWLVNEFWPQLAAGLASQVGSRDSGEFDLATNKQGDARYTITLDTWSRESTALLTATVLSPSFRNSLVNLEPIAPGVVEATFEAIETGEHIIIAESRTSRARHRFLVDDDPPRGESRDGQPGGATRRDTTKPHWLAILALLCWLFALWWERR